ncbi:LOW QUALITY PROTEIN: probable transporter mch1 [Amborella trichopoda]|uniref:LOW QUALITY PROTEIN: probable transporter mch1 n=1 Tax=Amborella trichopoda TaxID=13333 RepID=UPI0009C0F288|nr:LOW QUALITY PROTEIN: probable transporter mch1 [Amborella trichopoda]|eukprot:XP_020525545.1 LOW QUALITY PROTEIN: probable transporter mch1 [Amborella trichopoda]
MAIGHFLLAMAWPGVMYVGTLLIGLGYGTHWAVVPATASELFGLKNFGTLYNFITLANPAGALVFSGVIASTIYDYEAQKQAHSRPLSTEDTLQCVGAVCFFLTLMVMSGLCIFAAVLSMIAMHRTKVLYANLYGKSLS